MVRGNSSNGGRGNHQNSETITIEDSSSPYFLLNGDHLGLSLVSNPLNGSNYHTLRRVISMALTAKNNVDFVNGTISRPLSSDLLYNAWC